MNATNSHAGSRFLDGAVVLFALGNVTLFGAALTFRTIPEANLPILASLGTAVLSVVTGYAVWRFKTAAATPDPGTVTMTPPLTTLTGADGAPIVAPTGGSAITPPPPQTVNVVHMLGDPASALPPPPPMPPPTA